MADRLEFLAGLEEALIRRQVYLDERQIPRLKESFHAYQSALKSVIHLLLRKSLIKEDPYKHDQKISEVTLPSNDPVLDSEKSKEISLRLSNFDTQIDFLNSFYTFSTEFLNLGRVRLMSKLVNYILWEKLSETAGSINTVLLAELFSKVRMGGDKLSASVLNDAQNQLAKTTNEILAILRELTSYHRERYKLLLRKQLFAGFETSREEVENDRAGVLKKLKRRFAEVAAGGHQPAGDEQIGRSTPYYPELLSEILDEDYSEYGQNLRLGVLDKLKVAESRRAVKSGRPDFKPVLLEALRLVGTASGPLETAVEKLLENAQLLEQRKLGFAAKFRLWLIKLVRNEPPSRTYEIELSDPQTAITRVERLDFRAYAERAQRRSRAIANITNRHSQSYRKMAEADEELIKEFVSSSIDEVHEIYTKMPPLDAFFKSKFAGSEEKSRLKGIKMEVNAIKNAVVKSNQKLHEYLSRKEEEEQLQRLGIGGSSPP